MEQPQKCVWIKNSCLNIVFARFVREKFYVLYKRKGLTNAEKSKPTTRERVAPQNPRYAAAAIN